MYQRRMRTLAEQLLQPPGTPASQGRVEQRIEELRAAIAPDAALDLAKWGTWCCSSAGPFTSPGAMPIPANYLSMGQACDQIITNYLPQRRNFLFGHPEIPATMPTNPVIAIASIA